MSTQPEDAAVNPEAAAPDEEVIHAEKAESAKSILKKPVTLAAIGLLVVLCAIVVYVEFIAGGNTLPPPLISYEIEEAKQVETDGLPINVKVGPVSVFLIEDPGGDQGAARAKNLVGHIEDTVQMMIDERGRQVTLKESEETPPAIIQGRRNGTDRKTVVQLTEGDMSLSGEDDQKLVARVWAERFVDTLKLYGFGEPPKYSTARPFGQALQSLYDAAHVEGMITPDSLEQAYEQLSDTDRALLESLEGASGITPEERESEDEDAETQAAALAF